MHQLVAITRKNFIIKKRRWFLTLMEVLLPSVLVALFVFLKLFQGPLFIPSRNGAVRGLPSAGLFSVLASYCPSNQEQKNVDGFIVDPRSRQYQILELLNAFSYLLDNDNMTLAKSKNLSHLAYSFEDTLKKEAEMAGCSGSALNLSEWTDCIVNSNSSMERINASFLELQQHTEQLNLRTELLTKVSSISETLMPLNDHRNDSLSLIRFLSYLICGGELPDDPTWKDAAFPRKTGTACPGGCTSASNNHESRLGILEAMLQENGKILYAPNVEVVREVISKATESLASLSKLKELAVIVSRTLSESDEDSENRKLVIPPRSLLFIKQYYGEALTLKTSNIPPENRSIIVEKWLSLGRSNLPLPEIIGFDNESALERFALENPTVVIAGIVFEDVSRETTALNRVVKYKIRQIPAFTPTTMGARDVFASFNGPRDWDDSYYSYGFLWIQDIIERSIISVMTGMSVVEPGAGMQEMDYACFKYDR
ncbi:hypothetical protein GCK32_008985 [Trichostrongylus colubriformis]|uniref:Uncharacterized protein n=1 Tax=Trichostrongylus colubriformis TaxID=6319 RepID=A0AAN8FUS0_TRICO